MSLNCMGSGAPVDSHILCPRVHQHQRRIVSLYLMGQHYGNRDNLGEWPLPQISFVESDSSLSPQRELVLSG